MRIKIFYEAMRGNTIVAIKSLSRIKSYLDLIEGGDVYNGKE